MLKIGKYIKWALSAQNDPDLNEVLQGNVYHMLVPNDDHIKEYAVYHATGMDEHSTKDGLYGYTVSVDIEIVAKKYETLLDLVEEAATAMRTAPADWNDLETSTFLVTDQTVHYGEEVYDDAADEWVRTLSYTIETEINE